MVVVPLCVLEPMTSTLIADLLLAGGNKGVGTGALHNTKVIPNVVDAATPANICYHPDSTQVHSPRLRSFTASEEQAAIQEMPDARDTVCADAALPQAWTN